MQNEIINISGRTQISQPSIRDMGAMSDRVAAFSTWIISEWMEKLSRLFEFLIPGSSLLYLITVRKNFFFSNDRALHLALETLHT